MEKQKLNGSKALHSILFFSDTQKTNPKPKLLTGMRNLLLLTFSAPSPSYLLSSDAIISFLPSLLRRFVRTEEEPAKMMRPTGFFPRESFKDRLQTFDSSSHSPGSFKDRLQSSPSYLLTHRRCPILLRIHPAASKIDSKPSID